MDNVKNTQNTSDNNLPALIEGLDYYLENGRYVFTEHFLKSRGFCCRSGCRHCPYGFEKPAETDPPEQHGAIGDGCPVLHGGNGRVHGDR